MTRIQRSIVIHAPVEEVFSYASDWKKWTEWFEGVKDFKPSTVKEKGNGTRYAYQAKMISISMKVETEINDYEENRGWRGHATKGMKHKTFYHFEKVGNGTEFTCAIEYELPLPFLTKYLDRMLIQPQWGKILENSLRNLQSKFQ